MLFNSIDFAIFFPIVFIIYWILSKNSNYRNLFLLAASYLFYGWWEWELLSLIIISSAVDFYAGRKIYSAPTNKKKVFLALSLIVNLGFLIYFKYANFFIDTFVSSFKLFGVNLDSPALNIILPVGISFYTFQTLSYTLDIYYGRLKPTNNVISFFTFVAFFPQLVAGPIERASHLLPQFESTRTFKYDECRAGFQIMLWGLFKKMVIADRAAILVNTVYNNVGDHNGKDFIIATFFFAIQIYCDFSGYSDIAIGASKTMGFDLMQNFRSPYFSKSITEFWRRWHISLSTWFRDYVYIPLGGSKISNKRTYFNLFAVFFISGLWHGAALTFLLWGTVHGVIIVIEKISYKIRNRLYSNLGLNQSNYSNRLFFGIITFGLVCFAWIFFRANNITDAYLILNKSLNITEGKSIIHLGLNEANIIIAFISITILVCVDYFNNRSSLVIKLNNQSTFLRWSVYLVGIFSILLVGIYGDNTPEFIYFQF